MELIEKGQGAKDRASPHKANVQGRILSGLEESLELPSYPCHTKDVERLVSVVTESCLQKVGYSARQGWILSTMKK